MSADILSEYNRTLYNYLLIERKGTTLVAGVSEVWHETMVQVHQIELL